MLIVELILVLLLFGFALAGSRAGFFVTLGKLLGALLGFVMARAWYAWLGGYLAWFAPRHESLVRLIAFLILFMLVERLVGLIFRFVAGLFSLASWIPFAKTISRLSGGLLGLIEGVVIVGALVYAIMRFHVHPALVAWTQGSQVASYCERFFQKMLAVVM